MPLLYMRYGKYRVSAPSDRTVDGILFSSKAEMRRYNELRLLQKAKKIKDLAIQPKFLLLKGFTKNGKVYRPIHYVADFIYYDIEKKKKVVEDVKGLETEVFKLKEKLFAFISDLELIKVHMR